MKNTGPDRATRELVWERDRGICQWSGAHLLPGTGDLQHRRARGAGGRDSNEPWINSPANLVLVSRDSHRYIETHPGPARARGFRLDPGQHPAEETIIDYTGQHVFLEDNGKAVPYSAE